MATIKNLVNDFLTENQQATFKKLNLDPIKNADKIAKLLKLARGKQTKEITKAEKVKNANFKLDSYNEFRSFFNVFNHIKKSMKANNEYKHRAKVFTQKFNAPNVIGLLDFSTLVSIVKSGFNYGTKGHFNSLASAMIEYSELNELEQNNVNTFGQKLKFVLTAEPFNTSELFDAMDDDNNIKVDEPTNIKINKATAKFIFEHDKDLFDLFQLSNTYNHEYEKGLKDARKAKGQIGVAEFIEQWEVEQSTPKIKKTVKASGEQLTA